MRFMTNAGRYRRERQTDDSRYGTLKGQDNTTSTKLGIWTGRRIIVEIPQFR